MLPSTTLALAAARWSHARRDWRQVRAFKAGMAPIVIALLFATGWILAAETPGWRPGLLTLAAAVLVWRTRVHLLVLIGAGAIVGAARMGVKSRDEGRGMRDERRRAANNGEIGRTKELRREPGSTARYRQKPAHRLPEFGGG